MPAGIVSPSSSNPPGLSTGIIIAAGLIDAGGPIWSGVGACPLCESVSGSSVCAVSPGGFVQRFDAHRGAFSGIGNDLWRWGGFGRCGYRRTCQNDGGQRGFFGQRLRGPATARSRPAAAKTRRRATAKRRPAGAVPTLFPLLRSNPLDSRSPWRLSSMPEMSRKLPDKSGNFRIFGQVSRFSGVVEGPASLRRTYGGGSGTPGMICE